MIRCWSFILILVRVVISGETQWGGLFWITNSKPGLGWPSFPLPPHEVANTTSTDHPFTNSNTTTSLRPDVDKSPLKIHNNPHFTGNRSVIVHLHEWTFLDIARECEEFLGPEGYGGVQTSPVSENVILQGRPWYERYQPLSYNIATRSGDSNDFYEMTQRCRAVGVRYFIEFITVEMVRNTFFRIYVDVIPNHMTGNIEDPVGSGGAFADPKNMDYPSIPFSADDFHQPPCVMVNYSDPTEARQCEMLGLHDLNQTVPRVRWAIVNFLDRLTALGAAGFRVDAAKHIFPDDLRVI